MVESNKLKLRGFFFHPFFWMLILMMNCFLLASPDSAHAQSTLPSLGIEFRTDLELVRNSTSNDINRGQPRMLFKLERAHLNLRGQLDEDLSYHARVHWQSNAEDHPDQTNNLLEYWYISLRQTPSLQWQLGKQFILQGGFESSYNRMDDFGYSLVGEHIQTFYEVGASVFYDVPDGDKPSHTFVAQIFNEQGGGNSNQQLLTYNFAWYGTFAGGLLETIAQYGLFPHNLQRTRDPLDGKAHLVPEADEFVETLLSLGIQTKTEPLVLELDWLMMSENLSKTDQSSLVFSAKQEGESWQPFAKVIYDSQFSYPNNGREEPELRNRNTVQLGILFFPKLPKTFYRFHLVWAHQQLAFKKEDAQEDRLTAGVSLQWN